MTEKSDEDQINELISSLPGKDGWHSEQGNRTFQLSGWQLIGWGLTVEEAFFILKGCYHAASADAYLNMLNSGGIN